jgi:hypothetical protein
MKASLLDPGFLKSKGIADRSSPDEDRLPLLMNPQYYVP